LIFCVTKYDPVRSGRIRAHELPDKVKKFENNLPNRTAHDFLENHPRIAYVIILQFLCYFFVIQKFHRIVGWILKPTGVGIKYKNIKSKNTIHWDAKLGDTLATEDFYIPNVDPLVITYYSNNPGL